MKSLLAALALLASAMPALAQSNVSVTIGQPGFYGRIDIGDYVPQPVVYTQRPVVVERSPRYVAQPMYLRVPPGHRKNWSRHCGRYGACGQPVLFVRDDWYQDSYVPRYQEHYRDRDHRGGRDEYRDDRHGGKHGRDRDHGKGHGRDHDRDHDREHGRRD